MFSLLHSFVVIIVSSSLFSVAAFASSVGRERHYRVDAVANIPNVVDVGTVIDDPVTEGITTEPLSNDTESVVVVANSADSDAETIMLGDRHDSWSTLRQAFQRGYDATDTIGTPNLSEMKLHSMPTPYCALFCGPVTLCTPVCADIRLVDKDIGGQQRPGTAAANNNNSVPKRPIGTVITRTKYPEDIGIWSSQSCVACMGPLYITCRHCVPDFVRVFGWTSLIGEQQTPEMAHIVTELKGVRGVRNGDGDGVMQGASATVVPLCPHLRLSHNETHYIARGANDQQQQVPIRNGDDSFVATKLVQHTYELQNGKNSDEKTAVGHRQTVTNNGQHHSNNGLDASASAFGTLPNPLPSNTPYNRESLPGIDPSAAGISTMNSYPGYNNGAYSSNAWVGSATSGSSSPNYFAQYQIVPQKYYNSHPQYASNSNEANYWNYLMMNWNRHSSANAATASSDGWAQLQQLHQQQQQQQQQQQNYGAIDSLAGLPYGYGYQQQQQGGATVNSGYGSVASQYQQGDSTYQNPYQQDANNGAYAHVPNGRGAGSDSVDGITSYSSANWVLPAQRGQTTDTISQYSTNWQPSNNCCPNQ